MPTRMTKAEYPDYHTKRQISIRLTDDAHYLLGLLMRHFGIGKADAVEAALRSLARKEKLVP